MDGEDIFRISKDPDRARDLLTMAKERLDLIPIIPKDKTYKIIEEYYEIIKELLTAIMYLDGYKTLSHVKLQEYFSANYTLLQYKEVKLVDTLRKFRNGIVYYGKRISEDFLVNNESEINKIIAALMKLVEKRLNQE